MAEPVNTSGQRLERYTEQRPHEVLLVTVEVDGERDQVAIFRGFSSSLVRSTAFDPDLPVLASHAVIKSIDRLQSPYDPSNPHYIQQNLTWEEMQLLLEVLNV